MNMLIYAIFFLITRGQKLKSVEQERDLGIIVHSNGKMSEQSTMAANKANQILGMKKVER